jgi:ABC-type uncharacterized transport system involved in gliding motility auxiliary subunit
MLSKPWYVSTEKWEANEPNTIPGATVLPHFEQRLARIVHTADTDAQAQQRLTLELIREVHTQKLLTWWVLIVIPTIITVLGVIITIKVHPTTPPTTPQYGY